MCQHVSLSATIRLYRVDMIVPIASSTRLKPVDYYTVLICRLLPIISAWNACDVVSFIRPTLRSCMLVSCDIFRLYDCVGKQVVTHTHTHTHTKIIHIDALKLHFNYSFAEHNTIWPIYAI